MTVNPFLNVKQVTMDVGNHDVGVRNIAMNLSDDGTGFYDVVANIGNGSIRISWQQRW